VKLFILADGGKIQAVCKGIYVYHILRNKQIIISCHFRSQHAQWKYYKDGRMEKVRKLHLLFIVYYSSDDKTKMTMIMCVKIEF